MIKSIKFKIWLTFLITLAVSMMTMLLLTHASMKQGFLQYVNQQTIQKLDYLDKAVVDIYRASGSLNLLEQNESLWNGLKYQAFREFIEYQRMRERDVETSPPPLSLTKHQENFINHLVLTNADKQLIVGQMESQKSYSWREVVLDGRDIAYIGYVTPTDFLRAVDHHFIRKQLETLSQIGIVLVIVSFVVVLLISRWLVNPLTALSRNAKMLASGNFCVRIKPQSEDELGQLCNNFNELASTLSSNEKARKQWVADISHEMRTPLAVIKAQIEAMQDGIREPSEKNLAVLKDKVDSVNVLINDLYELSLSDLGAMTYSKEVLPLTEIVEQVTEEYKIRTEEKNLKLQVKNLLSEKDKVFGDSNRLVQMMSNFLENSLRYTDAPGIIEVITCRLNDSLQIHVKDSSPGVPADKLEQIFDRLFRLESSRNRETGGAGLGLSICKNIIDAHHGTVSASNSDMGGLHILVELPYKKS